MFEYKIVLIRETASPHSEAGNSELNNYAREGWELVTVWPPHYFMRRPVPRPPGYSQ